MAVIRSANSLADGGQAMLVVIGSITGLFCMIVAVLGIKLGWFKHRMTLNGLPMGGQTSSRHSRHEDLTAEPRIVRASFMMGDDFDSLVEYTPPAVLPPVRVNNNRPPLRPIKRMAPLRPVDQIHTTEDTEPFLPETGEPSSGTPTTTPVSDKLDIIAVPISPMVSIARQQDLDFGNGSASLNQIATEARSPTYAVVRKLSTPEETFTVASMELTAIPLPSTPPPSLPPPSPPPSLPPPSYDVLDETRPAKEPFKKLVKNKRPPLSNITGISSQHVINVELEPAGVQPVTAIAGEPIYAVAVKTQPARPANNAFLSRVATPPPEKPPRPPLPTAYHLPSVQAQSQTPPPTPQSSSSPSSRNIFKFLMPKSAKTATTTPPQSSSPSPYSSMPDLRAPLPPDARRPLARNSSASSLAPSPLAAASPTIPLRTGMNDINGRTKSSIFSFLKGGKSSKSKTAAITIPTTSSPIASTLPITLPTAAPLTAAPSNTYAAPPTIDDAPPSAAVIISPSQRDKRKKKITVRVLKEPKSPKAAVRSKQIKPALRNPLNRSESVTDGPIKPAPSVKFANLPSSDEESSGRKANSTGDEQQPVPRQRTKITVKPTVEDPSPAVRNGRTRVQSSSDDGEAAGHDDDAWNKLAQHRMHTQTMAEAQVAARQRLPQVGRPVRGINANAIAARQQQQRQIELINKPKTMREMRKEQIERRGKEMQLQGDGGGGGRRSSGRNKEVESDTEA